MAVPRKTKSLDWQNNALISVGRNTAKKIQYPLVLFREKGFLTAESDQVIKITRYDKDSKNVMLIYN